MPASKIKQPANKTSIGYTVWEIIYHENKYNLCQTAELMGVTQPVMSAFIHGRDHCRKDWVENNNIVPVLRRDFPKGWKLYGGEFMARLKDLAVVPAKRTPHPSEDWKKVCGDLAKMTMDLFHDSEEEFLPKLKSKLLQRQWARIVKGDPELALVSYDRALKEIGTLSNPGNFSSDVQRMIAPGIRDMAQKLKAARLEL